MSVQIKDFVYAPNSGAKITVHSTPDHPVCTEYAAAGYTPSPEDNPYDSGPPKTVLEIDEAGFNNYFPQILYTQVNRTMGGYPAPYLISKFSEDGFLSQISATYMISYILGMLARYFPTHWSALMGGEKGDAIWPNINAAQKYIEVALPELVLEVINSSLFEPEDEVLDASPSEAPDNAKK